MSAMIYAIFICTASPTPCQLWQTPEFFQSSKDCISYMIKVFGPGSTMDGTPKNGRLYLYSNGGPETWMECAGRPVSTWQPAQ